MQVELSNDELLEVIEIFRDYETEFGLNVLQADVLEKLDIIYKEAEELEGLDLNDCGDACKL